MIIRFYSIMGKTEAIENELRGIVGAIKNELARRGLGEDKVKFTIIKVKGDIVDDILKYLNQPESKIPGQYRSLIIRMRQDGVLTLPAIVINDRKIAEGNELNLDVIRSALINELKNEFGIEIPPIASPIVQQTVQPQQPQQAPSTPIQLPTVPIQPQPVRPILPQPPQEAQTQAPPPQTPPLPAQLTQQVPPIQQPPPQPAQEQVPIIQPPQPTQVQQPPLQLTQPTQLVTAGELRFRIVNGRPDDCNLCVYYGANRGYCYLFGFRVVNPLRPPCKSQVQ